MKITLTSLVRSRVARVLVVLVALATTLAAVPSGRPEDVGLSTERLQRINQLVQRYIDAKEIAGAVTVVSRRGRTVHFEAHGLMDIERNAPMRKDGIFLSEAREAARSGAGAGRGLRREVDLRRLLSRG